MSRSDGSTADYYVLPEGATQLQDLISHRNMNAQIGEIFRAGYRYGMASHSDMLRDAKKIRFYAQAEVERLEKLGTEPSHSKAYFEKCFVAPEPSHIISDIPSWDDAPELASWLAQDGVSPFAWVFYEHKPVIYSGSWLQSGGQWENTGPAKAPTDAAKTLTPRPTSTTK